MALVNEISYVRRNHMNLKTVFDVCMEDKGMHEIMKKAQREVHSGAARNMKACRVQYKRRL